ncbi:hypothetical protein [Fodinicola feengrottensis]|uniref:hypothetical protein n=1 Tax=Fodinicola feengrottensis TaxID=435914 RepID=UPI002442A96F|nr:hypothetical protein [Fodinicola feengrottensis]
MVAAGTAAQLKSQVGQRSVTATLVDNSESGRAVDVLRQAGLEPAYDPSRKTITSPVTASAQLTTVVRALDDASIEVAELALGEPTLDDVYLALAHSTATAA